MTSAFASPLPLLHSPYTNPPTNTCNTRKANFHPTRAELQPPVVPQQPASDVIPFPKLYDAWFPPHQLKTQMQACVTRAFADGHTLLELQWPTVPNLEELAAGTLLNFEFGKHVSEALGMDAPAEYMLVKRYLAQFCNLYWAISVSQSAGFADRTVWALSTDGVSKAPARGLGNVRLGSMRAPPEVGERDIVIVMDPRATSVWEKGVKLRPKFGATVFLNSQFSETYGLTGPRRGLLKEIETVYFLKRVTRGYAFRGYPGEWRAVLEKPDMGVEELESWEAMPRLREIAGVVRAESNKRYGGLNNDRYVKGFGGRL